MSGDTGAAKPDFYVEINAVNRAERLALINGDRCVPITEFYDDEGDPTADVDRAQYALVGPIDAEREQGWVWIDLDDYVFSPYGPH